MYENGYLNLGTIGTVEDPDSGSINALTAEQKKAVREYVALGIDKPIIATIPALSDNLSKEGYTPFGTHQFVQLSVVGNNILLRFPLSTTVHIEIPEYEFDIPSVEYVHVLTVTR